MRFVPVLVLLALVSACASSTDFDVVRKDLSDLKRESYDTRKDVDALKEKSATMVREESFSAVRENQADLTSRVSALSSGIQELRGRYEENKYNVEKSLRDMTVERDLLRAQVGALEVQVRALKDRLASFDMKEAPKKPAEEPKAEAETAAEPKKDEEAPAEKTEAQTDPAKKAYDAAYQAFKDQKYKESRGKFEAFLKEHPKHELAENAQFWTAESYYAEKDFEGAILAYETLLKKHPNSKKAAGALLKQGFAFVEIGDKKTGKTILNRLIERFPDSKEAAAAKKKLGEIDKKPNKKR